MRLPWGDPPPSTEALCNPPGVCPAGFTCEPNGRCRALPDGRVVPPRTIGAAGGVVTGPDRVELEVRPNALGQNVEIVILRVVEITGIDAVGAVAYQIEPTDLRFSRDAEVRIPLPRGAARTVRVYGAPSGAGPWRQLAGAASELLATGQTDQLGVFTLAVP